MGFTITVQELKEKLERGEKFVLVDVREPWEYNICKIPGAQLITDEPGSSPLAWQGSRVSAVITDVVRESG